MLAAPLSLWSHTCQATLVPTHSCSFTETGAAFYKHQRVLEDQYAQVNLSPQHKGFSILSLQACGYISFHFNHTENKEYELRLSSVCFIPTVEKYKKEFSTYGPHTSNIY
jgi:hypothetical protein